MGAVDAAPFFCFLILHCGTDTTKKTDHIKSGESYDCIDDSGQPRHIAKEH
jgi:hypothetical protein